MTTVRDVMTRNIIAVSPSATIMAAAAAMYARRAGSVLVLDGGRPVGILTERDVVRALSRNADMGRTSSVGHWMTPNPVTTSPDATVGKALDDMLNGGFRHLVVLEGDELVGVVSMRDLAGTMGKGGSGG